MVQTTKSVVQICQFLEVFKMCLRHFPFLILNYNKIKRSLISDKIKKMATQSLIGFIGHLSLFVRVSHLGQKRKTSSMISRFRGPIHIQNHDIIQTLLFQCPVRPYVLPFLQSSVPLIVGQIQM